MPLLERPTPKSRRATRSGTAIKATPVAASIAADNLASVLVFIDSFTLRGGAANPEMAAPLVTVCGGSLRPDRLVVHPGHCVVHFLLVFCRQLRRPQLVVQLVDRASEGKRHFVAEIHRRTGIEPDVKGFVDRHQQRNGVLDRLAGDLFTV